MISTVRARPGIGFGPQVSDPELDMAGIDPAQAAEWQRMVAERDAFMAQQHEDRQAAQRDDSDTLMRLAPKLAGRATDAAFPGARTAARDWIAEKVGLKKKPEWPSPAASRSATSSPRTGGEVYDPNAESVARSRYGISPRVQPGSGGTPYDVSEVTSLPGARYGGRGGSPQAPPSAPSVRDVAEAVKPAEGGASAATGAAEGAGTFTNTMGNVLGGLSIASGAMALDDGPVRVPKGSAGNKARAVGGASAVAGALGGAKAGAAMGSFFGPIGTMIGGVAGGVFGAIPGAKGLFGRSSSDGDKGYWDWRWY